LSFPRKRESSTAIDVGKTYHVYILASARNGTLYTGVTGSLAHRVYQHRNGTADGFTKRYRVTMLVHVEAFADVHEAIAREKAIKKWRRAWKLKLIEQDNPDWRDLYDDLI
jgi:putative endonuclease